MSYTTVYFFKRTRVGDSVDLRNAWGSWPRIWKSLYDAYVNDGYNFLQDGALKRLHDAVVAHPKHASDLKVLRMTYDYAVIPRASYADMAAALREFNTNYPVEDCVANHLPAIAGILDTCKAVAVAFNGTSVCGDNLYSDFSLKTSRHFNPAEPLP